MVRITVIFILVLSQIAQGYGENSNMKLTTNSFKSLLDEIVKPLIPPLTRRLSEIDIGSDCSASLVEVIHGIENFDYWAIRMLDAAGKPGGGQLRGSMSALGSYKECLDIALQRNDHRPALKGMYCLLNIRPSSTSTPSSFNVSSKFDKVAQKMIEDIGSAYMQGFRLGVCLPSLCTKQDVSRLVQHVADDLKLSAIVASCEVREALHIDVTQWVIISILGVFTVAVIICSCAHHYHNYGTSDGLHHRVLVAFSSISNLQKLLRTADEKNGDHSLSCLHGLRFFSMTWVVLIHATVYTNMSITNFSESAVLAEQYKEILYQCILNGTLAVDTFFFITSVIVSYNALKKNKKRSVSTTVIAFVRRILRLLPAAMLVLSLVVILPLFGSGPLWKEVTDAQANVCRKNWWSIPLFVTNFLNMLNMCIPHSWYISADMQYFTLALIFLFLYSRRPRFAMMSLGTLAVMSIISVISLCWYMEFIPTYLPDIIDILSLMAQLRYTYLLPYCHAAVYAIGLALGTFLSRERKIVLSTRVQVLGWILAVICNVSVIYVTVIWTKGIQNPVGVFPSFYTGLHRPLWALGLSWVTLVCARGYGGLLNKFLSWRGFGVLYKVSYMVYLIHIPLIWYQQGSITQLVESGHAAAVWNFFATLSISLGLSVILHVVFEAPLQNLENMVFGRRNPKAVNLQISENTVHEKSGAESTAFVGNFVKVDNH